MSNDPVTPDPAPAPEPQPAIAPPPPAGKSDKKLVAGILAILLGSLGIHKFYLGYTKEGVILLAATLILGGVTCGVGASVPAVVALIEGILYLVKSDAEFEATYVTGRKPWF